MAPIKHRVLAETWMSGVVHWFLLFAPLLLRAQTPAQVPPDGLIQIQVAQPPVDVSSPLTALAAFDPPTVRVGETTFYRVTIDATESSIRWPEKFEAPADIKLGPKACGQMTQLQGNRYRPVTVFAYEVRTTVAGRFSIPNLVVDVYGQPLAIPAANLEVVLPNAPPLPPTRQLLLETSETNIYLGQPIHVRVLLPATQANEIETLREVQFNGDGLITDKEVARQSVEAVNLNGQPKPTFIYATTLTPIAVGRQELSAQAFAAGRDFGGQIIITGQVTIPGGPPNYTFLFSKPVTLNVRPLPTEGELPGFTGALGEYKMEAPLLETNQIRVGEPVHLKVAFQSESNLTRFVPPDAPRSQDWQIIADKPPAVGFTLIPLTDEVHETPAIPFCAFNPAQGKYVDLTIPPLPVTVLGESLPTELRADEGSTGTIAPVKLTGLVKSEGKTATSLKPLQLQGWFVCLQLFPAAGFLWLWIRDRRRRYWEAHPDLARRAQALRALRSEKRKIQKAVTAGDSAVFMRQAANAMRIAVAPHYPANPNALVCGDVLAHLDATKSGDPSCETVRKIFEAGDSRFANKTKPQPDLLALHSEVTSVLHILEEKL